MILSIIIPVYKVEKYLEKCLLSCIHQDIEASNYEIIVINDGSPDNSGIIADSIASKYSNVRIIHQENKGLSGTRNEGFRESKGEYIWFIDSDDWIEDNCLSRIVSQLNDIDVLLLQYRKVYENGLPSVDIPFCIAKDKESGKDFLKRSLFPHPAQFAIYRKQFLLVNQLTFVEKIYHEDSEFKPRALYLANSLRSDTKISYNYLQRINGSITSSYSVKRILDIMVVIENLYYFSNRMFIEEQRAFNTQISINVNEIFLGLKNLSDNDRAAILKTIKSKKYIFKRMLKSSRFKYIIEGLLFSISPYICFRFYCLTNKKNLHTRP